MTLKEYFNQCSEESDKNLPFSIMYYLNSERDACEIEDFVFDKNNLYIEDIMKVPLNTEGEIVNGYFQFEYKRDVIGLELFF
jgi:hypothetical protein